MSFAARTFPENYNTIKKVNRSAAKPIFAYEYQHGDTRTIPHQ